MRGPTAGPAFDSYGFSKECYLVITIPRSEYPRPQFVRADWLNLNGPWEFDFDDDNEGLASGWELPRHHMSREIRVPFPFEAPLSGIGDPGVHKVVWYRREFAIPDEWQGRRVRLHFGAVDYEAMVWVNGHLVGTHRGGYTAFCFDITDALQPGLNVLTVRVFDDLTAAQPRGKQSLTRRSHGIWYTRCTGIWQTVWLEPVAENCLEDWRVEADLVHGQAELTFWTRRPETLTLRVEARSGDKLAGLSIVPVSGGRVRVRLPLEPFRPWSPADPHLYDLILTLSRGETVIDRVQAYFGLRQAGVADGMITLNNQPVYQKLVLDQAYWPDGVYTAPSDDAIRADVEWVLRFGLNGVRKHQVSCDPRFLYWADRLGLLIWADMPGQTFSRRDEPQPRLRLTGQAEANYLREYRELIHQGRNHPSIIAWVPFNETWGIYGISGDAATRQFLSEVVRLTRDLDPTRLVVDNDGWEHGEETDIFALHDYARDGATLRAHLETWGSTFSVSHVRPLIPGARYLGQPLVLSEYGGLGLLPAGEQAPAERWGYGDLEPTAESYLARYRGLQEALAASPHVAGYCYTQLTDVEQEINGLLSFHRQPKVDPAAIKALNDLVQGPGAARLDQPAPRVPVEPAG